MEKLFFSYKEYIKEFENKMLNMDSLLNNENLVIDSGFTKNLVVFLMEINNLHSFITSLNIPNEELINFNNYYHKYLEKIIKKLQNLKTSNVDINTLINIINWMPYEMRYKNSSFTIFSLLKEVHSQIDIYDKLLSNVINRQTKFIDSNPYKIIESINSPRIIISSCLRYCIEIVIKSFVTNNENYLKNDTNVQTYSFEQTVKTLHNKKYDYWLKIIDVDKSNDDDKCYFYFRSDFWKYQELIKNFDYLSDNTHYRPKKDPNIWIEKMHNLPEKNDVYNDFIRLKQIYSELINSLKKHIIFFENGNHKLMVEIDFGNYNNIQPIKTKCLDDYKVFALEE